MHGFIPPHPGPLAAIAILHADVGMTLALGIVVAIPCVAVAGPLFGALASRLVPVGAAGAGLAVTRGATALAPAVAGATHAPPAKTGAPTASSEADDARPTHRPTFAVTLATLVSPIALMLAKAGADIWIPKGAPARPLLDFIGDPVFALLFAVLLAMATFGTAVGFGPAVLAKKLGKSLEPVVGVMLIVGAGGGFKQALVDGGAGKAIAGLAAAAGLSPLLLGWILAVLIRLATGSATVATVTAAGIVVPLAANLAPTQLSLLVLSIGAGSVFFSHVNDAGFWLVKEYFGLTVLQTIQSWSLMETLLSVMGLAMTMLLAIVV
jgi:GntP family gluconate:H+ symporter